jgi:hypothetical protein
MLFRVKADFKMNAAPAGRLADNELGVVKHGGPGS